MLALSLDLWLDHSHHKQSTPPEEVQTLERFAEVMPPPQFLQSFQRNENKYLLWAGPSAPWYLLHSGPPTYIFDDSGRLIDWTPDRGDTPTFDKKWGWEDTPFIPLDEAKSRFKPRVR